MSERTLLLAELEATLQRLVERFLEAPYEFFTEADAVAAVQGILPSQSELGVEHTTADGFKTRLLHREYPTFFRFKKSDPRKRLGPPARRGHYDLVLLDPAWLRQHNSETAINRDINLRGDLSVPPLIAAVEFKLYAHGWLERRVDSVRRVLGKLQLTLQSRVHAKAAYLVVLQRDHRPKARRWDRHWPAVEDALLCWHNMYITQGSSTREDHSLSDLGSAIVYATRLGCAEREI